MKKPKKQISLDEPVLTPDSSLAEIDSYLTKVEIHLTQALHRLKLVREVLRRKIED